MKTVAKFVPCFFRRRWWRRLWRRGRRRRGWRWRRRRRRRRRGRRRRDGRRRKHGSRHVIPRHGMQLRDLTFVVGCAQRLTRLGTIRRVDQRGQERGSNVTRASMVLRHSAGAPTPPRILGPNVAAFCRVGHAVGATGGDERGAIKNICIPRGIFLVSKRSRAVCTVTFLWVAGPRPAKDVFSVRCGLLAAQANANLCCLVVVVGQPSGCNLIGRGINGSIFQGKLHAVVKVSPRVQDVTHTTTINALTIVLQRIGRRK